MDVQGFWALDDFRLNAPVAGAGCESVASDRQKLATSKVPSPLGVMRNFGGLPLSQGA